MEKSLISGIMQRVNLNAFMVSSILAPENAGQIFRKLARNRINIEFANQLNHQNGSKNIILCVDGKDEYSTLALLEEIKPVIKAREVSALHKVGILSMFPHREHALISGILIDTLSAAKISIFAMGSSISVVSCVINEQSVPDAIRLLSKAFGLA